MNSPLAKAIPTPMNTEAVKREGWRDHGILVVRADDARLGWVQREWVRQLGELLYGKGRS